MYKTELSPFKTLTYLYAGVLMLFASLIIVTNKLSITKNTLLVVGSITICQTALLILNQLDRASWQTGALQEKIEGLCHELGIYLHAKRKISGGLSQAFCELTLNMPSTIDVTMTVQPTHVRFSYEIELALYRITEEALSNIVKHAQAKQTGIRLDVFSNIIQLFIQDDGCGFELTTVKPIGLTFIREWVVDLGGTLEIETEANEGTALWVRIPINRQVIYTPRKVEHRTYCS